MFKFNKKEYSGNIQINFFCDIKSYLTDGKMKKI